jgi:hypothetical protein
VWQRRLEVGARSIKQRKAWTTALTGRIFFSKRCAWRFTQHTSPEAASSPVSGMDEQLSHNFIVNP